MDKLKVAGLAMGVLVLCLAILYGLIYFAKMPGEILLSLKAIVPLIVGAALIAMYWPRKEKSEGKAKKD